MPMNPRLLRPKAAGAAAPTFAPAGYTRLWAVTTQSGGSISGSAETDSGYYAVKWWDNSVDIYDSGDPFSKAAAGSQRAFEVYPCDSAGDPSGQFDGFDLANNSITQLRAEDITLASGGGTGGYYTGWPYNFSTNWLPYVAPFGEAGVLSGNLLSATALDQFYTDLNSGTGFLAVGGNPGVDADDPTIATAKGYTVFGSVPPETALLLNFNGTNGSTTFIDSSPNAFTVTAHGNAQISTAQSKFGGSSLLLDGAGDYLSVASNSIFGLGTEDFTIEFWVYPDAGNSDTFARFIQCGQYPNGWQLVRGNVSENGDTNPIELMLDIEGGSPRLEGGAGGVVSNNTWSHVAITRSARTLRMFVNGTLAASTDAPNDLGEYDVVIGSNATGGESLAGYIDDLRIVAGTALYTSNFTPPASELEVYP